MPEDVEGRVSRHYAQRDLETIIVEALRASGLDPDALKPDDLAPIDEFHMGGRPATAALVEALGLQPANHVLDIGCGLGGVARYVAGRAGCRVTGVDLTPDYVEAAAALTRRVGLAGLADFQAASALDLPFGPARFDVATLIHVGMNVTDKGRLCREAARVLKPGGRFALYDVMRVGSGDITYPTAWAVDPDTSFIAEPAVYRQALEAAGFTLLEERDQTELALANFRRARARVAERGPPPLGLHLLMGPAAGTKAANMVAALESSIIAPILMVARRR